MENNLKYILTKNGFSFKKAFGQNFLTDDTLLSSIVKKAGVTKEDTVLEIGCGAGTLTKVLSQSAKNVVGYEIDVKLKSILNEVLADCTNTEIIYKDIMKEKISDIDKKLGKGYILVANLPYYITTPIVTEFLENSKNLRAMIITIQEEVALRFTAKNGTSDYGAITVGINLRGDAEIIEKIPRTMFTPMPNVDSAVVKIEIKDKFPNVDKTAVRDVVRVGFSSRRKMLVNNFMNCYKISRVDAESILNNCRLSLTVRGETLSCEEYIMLSEELKKMGVHR